MKLIYFFFTFFLFAPLGFATTDQVKTIQEKELELLNFKNLKNELKNDGLEFKADEKKQVVKKIKQLKKEMDKDKFLYPSSKEFSDLLVELWLVKNASTLRWDIVKPDYGIEESFKKLLEVLGIYEKDFYILLHNNNEISHFSIPYKESAVFLLSIPFIRAMDLSKAEIGILLLEDYFRIQAGYYFKQVVFDSQLYGTSFKDKSLDLTLVDNKLKEMNEVIREKGYSFQQQFDITKKMSDTLKSDPNLWNAYISVLKKIDELIKSNPMFENYVKQYPSPEMQLQWLLPSKKKI
jgi:hypothetical protein